MDITLVKYLCLFPSGQVLEEDDYDEALDSRPKPALKEVSSPQKLPLKSREVSICLVKLQEFAKLSNDRLLYSTACMLKIYFPPIYTKLGVKEKIKFCD